ncbi:MAG: hypothetical protein IPO13_13215 [Rhodocyclaceae bacterium]|nr:hypothetical protein [Rhodocyclaceae bacterium]
MKVVMDMSTGKIIADEFGAFEDEVLNAEWVAPGLQTLLQEEQAKGLQPNNTRAQEQHELDADAFLGMMYRVQS